PPEPDHELEKLLELSCPAVPTGEMEELVQRGRTDWHVGRHSVGRTVSPPAIGLSSYSASTSLASCRQASTTSCGSTGRASPARLSSHRVNGSSRRTLNRRRSGWPSTDSPSLAADLAYPRLPVHSTMASTTSPSPRSQALRLRAWA